MAVIARQCNMDEYQRRDKYYGQRYRGGNYVVPVYVHMQCERVIGLFARHKTGGTCGAFGYCRACVGMYGFGDHFNGQHSGRHLERGKRYCCGGPYGYYNRYIGWHNKHILYVAYGLFCSHNSNGKPDSRDNRG